MLIKNRFRGAGWVESERSERFLAERAVSINDYSSQKDDM